jgi:hypothetical protein
MGEVYNALSSWEQPLALAALNHARRTLETRRRADRSPLPPPPEWATPALFCAGIPLILYDPKAPFEALQKAPEPVFDPGVVVRRIGDMVGRRSEQRLILRSLRDPAGAGVMIQGIGGVGKSTLAAQILHRLAADDDFVLVSLEGETNPDRVLGAIATRLLTVCLARGSDERHPWRRLASFLRELKVPWRDRFDVLAQNLLSAERLAFLFDNFEDNLHDGAPPEQLAELLSLWLQRPGKSRLLFTSRHPFALPDDVHERLFAFPLGPLSWAETPSFSGGWRASSGSISPSRGGPMKTLAAGVNRGIITQLDTWGAWEWEERLTRDTLASMPDSSSEAAALLHQLGMVAQHRGDYDGALDWYRKSLAIEEQLGNRAGMANSYGQLGMVAQDR